MSAMGQTPTCLRFSVAEDELKSEVANCGVRESRGSVKNKAERTT